MQGYWLRYPVVGSPSGADIYSEMIKQTEPPVIHLATKQELYSYVDWLTGRDAKVISFLSR